MKTGNVPPAKGRKRFKVSAMRKGGVSSLDAPQRHGGVENKILQARAEGVKLPELSCLKKDKPK